MMSSKKKNKSVPGSSPQKPIPSNKTTRSRKNIKRLSQLQSPKKSHIYFNPPIRFHRKSRKYLFSSYNTQNPAMCERCKLTVLKPYYITYKGGEIINNKDLEDLKSVISDLKASDTDVDALQNEIKKKGLEKEVNDFTKKYGSQIKKFMHDLDNKGSLDTEEKAKMVMQLQEKMTPEQQKQFKSVVNTLKDYLKKRKG